MKHEIVTFDLGIKKRKQKKKKDFGSHKENYIFKIMGNNWKHFVMYKRRC